MKQYSPQALAEAQRLMKFTTRLMIALFLLSALLGLMDYELVPAFLPAPFFADGARKAVHTAALAGAAQAGFWYNLAQETGREARVFTIRIALLILLAGDILLAIRSNQGIAAVFTSLGAVLLMGLLFELCWRQFSRVDAVRSE